MRILTYILIVLSNSINAQSEVQYNSDQLANYYFSGNCSECTVIALGGSSFQGDTKDGIFTELSEFMFGKGHNVLNINYSSQNPSTGIWSQILPEVINDIDDAIDYVRNDCPNTKIWLIGFSSGAISVLHYAHSMGQYSIDHATVVAGAYLPSLSLTPSGTETTFIHPSDDNIIKYNGGTHQMNDYVGPGNIQLKNDKHIILNGWTHLLPVWAYTRFLKREFKFCFDLLKTK